MGASIEELDPYLAAERTLWRQYGLEPRQAFHRSWPRSDEAEGDRRRQR